MQIYSGVRTDSSRWSKFELRPGDVIVSTPPKCGTTWMIAVVSMLLHGNTELSAPTSELSPWLDYSPTAFDEICNAYGSQVGRRLIKTHTPVDGLPRDDGVHIISVLRNPLDAIRSMRRHVFNMVSPPKGDPFLKDENAVIARALDLAFRSTNVDDVSLELLVHHLRVSVLAMARKDREITLVHYSDMKRDLRKEVERVAAAVQATASQEFLDDVVEAASISSMRSKAEQFAPLSNVKHFTSTEKFFGVGEERGHEKLAPHLKTRYKERLAELLPPSEAAWLDGGGAPQSVVG